MNASEALYLAEMLNEANSNVFTSNIVGEKLYELLFFRLKKKKLKKELFCRYLDVVDTMGYRKSNNGNSIERENIVCEGVGWNWNYYIGLCDTDNLNHLNIFLYECTDFAISYQIYTAFVTYGTDVKEYLEQDVGIIQATLFDAFLNMYDSLNMLEWLEYGLEEECGKGADPDVLLKYYVYGAYYISCKVSGEKMEKKYRKEFEKLALEAGMLKFVDCKKYYDSFFGCLWREKGITGKAQRLILPYVLDVYFSFKDVEPGDIVGTPHLYIYSSKSMKEYKNIRGKYATHPYIKVLDELLGILENPVKELSMKGDGQEGIVFTDCFSMNEPNKVSTCYGYTDKEYVRCYYFFESGVDVSFQPYFWLARECFDTLLQDLKKHAAVM